MLSSAQDVDVGPCLGRSRIEEAIDAFDKLRIIPPADDQFLQARETGQVVGEGRGNLASL